MPISPNGQFNLEAWIAEFNLTLDFALHDPLNVFMKTGMDEDGRIFSVAPDAKDGDYIELLAEMDCLVAVSACPSGGPSVLSGLALGVTIYDVVA